MGKVRSSLKKAAIWVVRPGFFGKLPINPLAGIGVFSRVVTGGALKRLKAQREADRAIRSSLEAIEIDPTLRDRFLFESYVEYHDLSDADLAHIHRRAAAFAYQRLLLPLVLAAGVFGLSHIVDFNDYFLFRVLWNNHSLLLLTVIPPLIMLLTSAMRYTYFAFCVRHRRNSSIDTFLLWISDPAEWFPRPSATIPARDLPPELLRQLESTQPDKAP